MVERVVDLEHQSVSLTLPDGVTRVAKRYKNQGCVALPIGEESVYFTPTDVPRNLPQATTTPWPMGDALPDEPWPVEVDMIKVEAALDAGFGPPEARTLALLVTYKGRIIGERYSDEVDIPYPARVLVDDQEPDRHARGCAGPQGRVRALAAGADSRVADAGRPASRDSHR